MTFNPLKIKTDEPLECQACAIPVTEAKRSFEMTELFKELTRIEPLYDSSEVIFCKNCQSTLEAFKLFKNLCIQTQEIFASRQVCDTEQEFEEEEFEVAIEVEEPDQSNSVTKDTQFYTCDMCQKEFKTKKGIIRHISHVHLKNMKSKRIKEIQCENVYECNECGAQLSSLRNLKRHQATHNIEKSFKCSFCDSKFNSQQNQYYHEKYVHKTGRQYVCADCGYVCYNPTVMNQHIQRHHGILKFRCDKCPKECKTRADLRDHMLVHENLEKTIPCPMCGTLFKHMKGMKSHMRAVHTAERKFICETCSKGFIAKNGLDRHMVTHTGERKFPCNLCAQAFTQLQALKRHLILHTGVRPYACPYCNHTFAEKFYMKKHASNCTKRPREVTN